MRASKRGLSVLAAAALCAAASAEIIQVQVALDGLQEVPPNASPGWGMATVTADTVTRNVDVYVEFHNLLAQTTAAHLHGLAAPGQNAGVLFGLTFMGDHYMGNAILSEANFAGFMQGLTYINVHTQAFPGGEIRGQVLIPAPGAAVLAAFAGLTGRRRRRA